MEYKIGYIDLEKDIYSSSRKYSIEAVSSNDLEGIVYSEVPLSTGYGGSSYIRYVENSGYVENKIYIAHPEIFLNPARPFTRFINTSDAIKELIEETFRLTTGNELPKNLVIKVCSFEELRKEHGSNFNKEIVGFSINNSVCNQIFVKQDHLDRLMITLGHEIGHILTSTLKDRHNEEAKAFAFEFAWVYAIRENNIGNLGNCLRKVIPAKNDLHDVAFNFVFSKIKEGKSALELFEELSEGFISLDKI